MIYCYYTWAKVLESYKFEHVIAKVGVLVSTRLHIIQMFTTYDDKNICRLKTSSKLQQGNWPIANLVDAKNQIKYLKLSSIYQQELNFFSFKRLNKYPSFKSSSTLAQQQNKSESGTKQKLKFQFSEDN